jgi:hypothetical protein
VHWLIAVGLITVALTPQETQDVQMSGFAFQLPRVWTVKTDAHYKLVASLATTFDPEVMPWVTVTVCDDTADHRCPAGDLNLSLDKTCPSIQRSVHDWPNGVRETRWVCPLLTGPSGLRGSSSVTQFGVGKKKLLMYYLATDHDVPPTEFLDDFAKSLRTE